MAEEMELVAEQVEDEPQGEEQTDWEAKYRETLKHSRDWEKLAKKNKDAATELEALKEQQMSEVDRIKARAEKAEAELASIAAERDRLQAASDISASSGVPSELLAFCADRDAMERFTVLFKEHTHTPAAPKTQASRIVRDSETPTSNRDVFAEMASNVL